MGRMLSIKMRSMVLGAAMFLVWSAVMAPAASANSIRLTCSAQVYEVFRGVDLDVFEKKTGLKLIVDVVSSPTAISRLENGMADVAAVAERVATPLLEKGFQEIPFCKDKMVVIGSATNKVNDLSMGQLRVIFAGLITNWQAVGGPDKNIVVIIPDKGTALYKNFSRMVMEGKDTIYDILTARSTFAADVARRFEGAITFVNQGATFGRPSGAKIIKLDGLGPDDPQYPLFEVFSLVVKGEPTGPVKTLVDYVQAEHFKDLIKTRGMTPYEGESGEKK